MSETAQKEKAIILSIVAFAAFSVSDGLRKYVSVDYAVVDILFWMAVFGMGFMVLLSPFLGGVSSLLMSSKRNWHIARGVLMAINTICSLIAISQVPLMDAYTIFFLTPFVTAIIFAVALKEKIGAYSMAAIVCGFIGGVVAFRPGFVELHPAYLYAVGCTVFFSLANLMARISGASQSRSLISFGFWPFFFVAIGTFVYMGGRLPIHDLWFFSLCAVIGAAYGSALILIAYSYTQASAGDLAPYQYTQIIFALIIGYVLFGAWPDGYKIAGSVIIISSGLFLFMRQRRKRLKA